MSLGITLNITSLGLSLAGGLSRIMGLFVAAIISAVVGDLLLFPGLAAWVKGVRGMGRLELGMPALAKPLPEGPLSPEEQLTRTEKLELRAGLGLYGSLVTASMVTLRWERIVWQVVRGAFMFGVPWSISGGGFHVVSAPTRGTGDRICPLSRKHLGSTAFRLTSSTKRMADGEHLNPFGANIPWFSGYWPRTPKFNR
jgi:hypothetical protein